MALAVRQWFARQPGRADRLRIGVVFGLRRLFDRPHRGVARRAGRQLRLFGQRLLLFLLAARERERDDGDTCEISNG
ncbi:hypothetical protein [Nannocystis pusilla]|uniref:hypothetical protein n=1 Tax=Nannocystis pusilla TaxID=889268 RepID=UPI003DA630CD